MGTALTIRAVFLDQTHALPHPQQLTASPLLSVLCGSGALPGLPLGPAAPLKHSLLHAVPVRSRSTSGVQSFTHDVA